MMNFHAIFLNFPVKGSNVLTIDNKNSFGKQFSMENQTANWVQNAIWLSLEKEKSLNGFSQFSPQNNKKVEDWKEEDKIIMHKKVTKLL